MRDIIENKEIKVNERNIIPLAEVKEESDVTLNLELYKNNIPFDVTGQSIKLGLLINGEIIGEQSDGITVNKNVVIIKLKNSFIQPGKLELDLTLTDNTGRMTTSSFYLIVNKKTIGGTSIQGTDLLETLDQIILDFEINFRETINGIKADYDSLRRIIIDENQAANLQEQINSNKDKNQLITTDISDIKTTIGELTESDVIQNKNISDIKTTIRELTESDVIQNEKINEEKNNRINAINGITDIINAKLSGIYLNDMEGNTDFEKLQNAIIKIIKGDNRNIILDRKVVMPSSKSLLINREVEGSYLTDNHLGHQINIYGIGNGGIIKKDNGFIFDSTDINNGSDESIITFTGQIALYNMYIEGNKENAIINGDRLIRFTVQNCDINKIKLVKSIKFTQSLYFLNNRIRWWNGNCIDTNNNYDLTVKNNLFEFGQNFWTFKGANGVRIADNVIEGLTGYVVKAKPESSCNSLVIDGNYVEGNKEYFDFTELKGNGLRVSNTFSHTTESSPYPVIFYLPIKAYETGSHLDETVFISNSDTGNSWLYDFKSKPSDFVKIICIGDRGNIKTKEYSKYLTFVGRTLSEAGSNPSFKKYRKGDVDVIYGNHQETITLSSGTKVHVIEIDTGFILNETDLVSIQYNGGGGNYDYQAYIANVNICSHIIKDNSTKLKVIVSPTGNYLGQVIVNLKISILKTPFTVF